MPRETVDVQDGDERCKDTKTFSTVIVGYGEWMFKKPAHDYWFTCCEAKENSNTPVDREILYKNRHTCTYLV
jgi:hypothetical protein